MDLLIARVYYPKMYHSFVVVDMKQNHTFAVLHDDEVVSMDGLNIGET
jgi:hypothetical protein